MPLLQREKEGIKDDTLYTHKDPCVVALIPIYFEYRSLRYYIHQPLISSSSAIDNSSVKHALLPLGDSRRSTAPNSTQKYTHLLLNSLYIRTHVM